MKITGTGGCKNILGLYQKLCYCKINSAMRGHIVRGVGIIYENKIVARFCFLEKTKVITQDLETTLMNGIWHLLSSLPKID